MKQVKTARGRVIDMAALAKTNETNRAVSPGNVNMNARGDRIDKSGNVLQTVKAKARAQHDTTTAPEKRRLSDAPGTRDTTPKPKDKVVEPDIIPQVVRQEEKTRDDGTSYTEIEFDDGSMQTKEMDK